MESKFGFIPGAGENVANRVRRKFRMIKGGNPQLILVHYGRGQPVRKSPSPSTPTTSSTCDLRFHSMYTKRQP